jgi:hypothetical protein
MLICSSAQPLLPIGSSNNQSVLSITLPQNMCHLALVQYEKSVHAILCSSPLKILFIMHNRDERPLQAWMKHSYVLKKISENCLYRIHIVLVLLTMN